MYNSVPITFH